MTVTQNAMVRILQGPFIGGDSSTLPSQVFPMFPSLDWDFQLLTRRDPGHRISAPIPSAVTRIEWGTRGNLEDQFLFSFVNLNHSHSLLEDLIKVVLLTWPGHTTIRLIIHGG